MNEKVGINQRSKEYIMVIFRGKKMQRYRAVWIEHHGEIPAGMMIHHKNGNKKDDRIENLELLSREEHGKKHRKPNRKRIKYKSGAVRVVKIL